MTDDVTSDFLGSFSEEIFGVTIDDSNLRTSARNRSKFPIPVTSGLEEIAQFQGYAAYHPPGNTDPWVRASLKIHDTEMYDSIYGFTRRGEGLPGVYKALSKYGGNISKFTDMSVYQRSVMKSAIAKARSAFTLPVKHQPLDWHEVGQHMQVNTSAGVSFRSPEGRILKKKECMPQVYTEARWLGHRMKEGGKNRFDPRKVRFPPCLAGQRGHLSPVEETKTRLVWIYPAEMLVVEGLWAPVMYKQLAQLPNGPLLLGKGSQRLYTEWLVNYREGEILHGLDFSSFDTSVPPWLIHVAFEILHQNVDWLNWRGKATSKRSRQKWRNVWDGMKWYFINTPIMMPDGRTFRKHHGVPSGSFFTQLIDSVVNYILVEYLAGCQGVEVRNLKVLGDDSAFRSPFAMSGEKAAFDAASVNMRLHVEKCDITTEPTEFKLLGTKYRNGHAHRPDDEWFKLALYPENVPPDIDTSMSRLVGLWLAGAMFNPAFCDFFEYYQSCYSCPTRGWFSKDQRKWLQIVFGRKAPPGWTNEKSLFWRSIFYCL